MAVPKRKVSRARRDKRRSSHWKLAIPGVVACPKCGEPRLPHRACKACGYYNGREVISVEASNFARYENEREAESVSLFSC